MYFQRIEHKYSITKFLATMYPIYTLYEYITMQFQN